MTDAPKHPILSRYDNLKNRRKRRRVGLRSIVASVACALFGMTIGVGVLVAMEGHGSWIIVVGVVGYFAMLCLICKPHKSRRRQETGEAEAAMETGPSASGGSPDTVSREEPDNSVNSWLSCLFLLVIASSLIGYLVSSVMHAWGVQRAIKLGFLLLLSLCPLLVAVGGWRLDSGKRRLQKLANAFFSLLLGSAWAIPFELASASLFRPSILHVPNDAIQNLLQLSVGAAMILTYWLGWFTALNLAKRKATALCHIPSLVVAIPIVAAAKFVVLDAETALSHADGLYVKRLAIVAPIWLALYVAMYFFYRSDKTREMFQSATKTRMLAWLQGKRFGFSREVDAATIKAAAVQLGHLGPYAADAAPELLKHVEHDSPAVRRAVAKALGQIAPSSTEVVLALQRLQKDRDRSVRQAAAEALEKIKAEQSPGST